MVLEGCERVREECCVEDAMLRATAEIKRSTVATRESGTRRCGVWGLLDVGLREQGPTFVGFAADARFY